jgi:hypothetical protein
MEKEKQIEEMAKFINGSKCPTEKCPKMDKEQEKAFGPCNIHRAQILYDAGYGNVKEAVKEFAERVKGIFSGNAEERQKGYAKEIVCSLTIDEFNEEIDELIKEVRGE